MLYLTGDVENIIHLRTMIEEGHSTAIPIDEGQTLWLEQNLST